jgi:RNA recognition motif-containing protein
MNNKLYVGGLPYSVTEGQLQEIFTAHGTVESARVTDFILRTHPISIKGPT